MVLTRDYIIQKAEAYGFELKGFEPGLGTRADVVLKCERTEHTITIGQWPCSSENELARLLSMAIAEFRPDPTPIYGPHR
jgi:hypothetical protein